MLNRYVLTDVETIAAPDAEQWMAPIEPDCAMTEELNTPIEAAKNLVDPVKIAADIAKKTAARETLPAKIAADMEERKAAQLEAAPLDPDLCRLVAMGWQTEDGHPYTILITDETSERNALNLLWSLIGPTRPMVGYGLTWFDAGVFVRRSQLLGVLVPSILYEQGKYRHPVIVELADRLTLNGMIDQKKGRGLEYHCQRFGIEVDDPYTGKDITALWKAGNVEAIKGHCAADIQRIRLLAERLAVIPVAVPAGSLVF